MAILNEWQQFLIIYRSSKSDALKFARKMTDEQNRNSALNFLKKKPSKNR